MDREEPRGERTSLHVAAFLGREELARVQLRWGSVEVNARDKEGCTPLHLAARKGHRDVVELLVAEGADVNARNEEQRTPLYCAIQHHAVDVVRLLVGKTDLATGDLLGRTPLHYAAAAGDTGIVRLLLEAGAETKAKDSRGLTPLHLALASDHEEVAALLLNAGADAGHKDAVDDLIAGGANITIPHKETQAPLEGMLDHEDVDELLADPPQDKGLPPPSP